MSIRAKIASAVAFAPLLCFLSPLPFFFVTASVSSTGPTEAVAECVMELNSRRVLYEKKGDVRLPMASTTKIATAATVLRLGKGMEEEVSIPSQAVGIEGSSVYLKAGDVYTVEDLLYGLMLRSGNDCATALALHCSSSVAAFSAEMNETAQAAGALHTSFQNPHGLPANGHYTTARDLSLITCYALQNPTFKQIVSTKFYQPRGWKNKNRMLSEYDGAIGVKTGYTKEAGRCLVSAAEREGMTWVCSVLNCPTTYERSTQLLDDAFEAYSYEKILDKEQRFFVEAGKEKIACKTGKDFYYPLLKEEKGLIEIKTVAKKTKKKEKIVGQVEIYLAKRLLFSGNLYKL